MKLWLDTETYSELDLKTVGTYRYAENCEIMLITYAIDDGPVKCWDLTQDLDKPPRDFMDALLVLNREIWAHNAMFDRQVMRGFFQFSIDVLRVNRWRDTMIQAFSHGLPGSLDQLCEIYKIAEDKAKIKDGRRLIQLFCKPRPKNSKIVRATRFTHPEEWERFKQYAMNDISAMRELHYKMPKWNYPNNEQELRLWHLDQVKNNRGILVDREMGEAVIRAVARAKVQLAKETKEQTNGELESTTQRDATLEYILQEYGVHIDGLTKDAVKRALEDEDIPEAVKELLRIRQQASSTSTSKYRALLNRASADGRFRGGIQFSGAARTRRASGRGFQPQNLPSRGLIKDWLIDEGIELMKVDLEHLVFPNVMHLAVSAVRKMLIAAPGKKFCIADLSNIEGRKVAWYADEEWKLKAFSEFDQGIGHDLYNLTYARAFKVPVETVIDSQRQIGKVMELMLGYQGGVGAFVTGAATYGFKMENLADDVFDTLPRIEVDESYNFLEWLKDKKGNRYGLSDKAFMTADVLKRLWRKAHPGTTKLWDDLQNAAIAAIVSKKPRTVGKLVFDMKGSWLRIALPSGRFLCYPHAKYDFEKGITYYGINQYTRQWSEIKTYGGKFLENICQSSARDTLYDAIPRMEEQGFPLVLDVHDEAVTETDLQKDVKELCSIMTQGEPWTAGLPLAAKGFESSRYRKG